MSDTAGQVSDETLAELRRLAAEATPGPWAWDADGDSYMGCGEVFTWGEGVEGGNIAAPSGDLYPRSGYAPQADMKFIAMMDPPTTLALLDALDAARAEVERLRIGLDGAHGNADRMRKSLLDERDAIAEKIAVAIEAEMRRHDGAQIGFSGKGDTYAHAARIAREVGKA